MSNPANSELRYSVTSAQKLTEQFEGCRLTAYQDGNKVWTIGYGHTGSYAFEGNTITQHTAEALLLTDIVWAESAIKSLVKMPLVQAQFDALVDFVFNIGYGNFSRSTLLKAINAGRLTDAATEFMHWDIIAGKESKGLARRRLAEKELFEKGVIG